MKFTQAQACDYCIILLQELEAAGISKRKLKTIRSEFLKIFKENFL